MQRTTGRFLALFTLTLLMGVLAPAAVLAFGDEDVASRRERGQVLRSDMLHVVSEYRVIVTEYGMGDEMAASLDNLRGEILAARVGQFEAVADELGPMFGTMRENVDALRFMLEERDQARVSPMVSDSFPDADYPAVNIVDFVIDLTQGDYPSLWDGLGFFFVPDIPEVSSYGVPLICEGDPDGDGFPNRWSESFLMTTHGINATTAAIADVAGRLCEQDLVIIGEGGNLSVVCIATDILKHISQAIVDNIFMCESFIDSAEVAASYQRLGHLHDDVVDIDGDLTNLGTTVSTEFGVVKTRIEEVRTAVAVHDVAVREELDRLNAKADRILVKLDAQAAFLAEFKALSIRMAVEENLTGSGPTQVSLFQLPQAHGGYLEVVREVVRETIDFNRAAGQPTYGAEREFQRGEASMAKADYKDAYSHFRKAYTEAVK